MGIRVVAEDAATLGRQLGMPLVPALGPAGRSPGSLAAAVAAWVHAVDATPLLGAEDGLAFGLDSLTFVVGVASSVGVVAVYTAALSPRSPGTEARRYKATLKRSWSLEGNFIHHPGHGPGGWLR